MQTPEQVRTSVAPDYLAEHRLAINEAARRIRPHIRHTPTLPSPLDHDVFLKCECFQVTGSFKPRGAFNAVLRLSERDPKPRGVIAVSSGNHAQAVALAARTAGLPAVILIPEDANPQKIAATRALGAEVITEGITFENREQRVREVGAERGLVLVHPFDDWDVIHGQASAALEILEAVPDVGLVATPIGGGGLATGTALALKSIGNGAAAKVVAVEPEVADDAFRSWQTKSIQRLDHSPKTLADGVRSVSIGEHNFEALIEHGLLDAVVTVSESEIEEAVVTAWTRLKLALEPTGALPVAALMTGRLDRYRTAHRPSALIVTGGNFDPGTVARLLSR